MQLLSLLLPLVVSSLLPVSQFSVSAVQITVGVGQDQVTGLAGTGFDPSLADTSADSDVVVFTFLQGTHRVVQSSFDSPCTASGSFDSGLQTVANGTTKGGPTFTFTPSNISATYYFSDIGDGLSATQDDLDGGNECLRGAVFCLNTNETSSTSSCAAFKAAALSLGASENIPTSTRTATPTPTSSSTSSSTSTSTSNASSGSSSTGSGSSSASSAAATKKTSGVARRTVMEWSHGVGVMLLAMSVGLGGVSLV